jgi:hypothetical protein
MSTLPHIYQIVDCTTSCEPLSFLDVYSGYHQISLAINDEEKNRVHHTVHDFLLHQDGLRPHERGGGRGATYQRCVHIVLELEIGRNVEAYINDIVVKLKKCGDPLDDLKETFNNLRKYKLMLNPKKCVFNVSLGKLLGYMVSSH